MERRQDDELSSINDDCDEPPRESAESLLQEPAPTRGRHLVVLGILFVELCERLTFYGVTVNLVFYCRDVLNLASPLPSTITLAFQGKVSV